MRTIVISVNSFRTIDSDTPREITVWIRENYLTNRLTNMATIKTAKALLRKANLIHETCKAPTQEYQTDFAIVLPHLMTLVARIITTGGNVRPRAFAVFRLITSSNFVGCSTGKSAG